MLQLVVLWHELGQDVGEMLDLRCQLKLLDKSVSVLLELLRLNLLVRVDKVDSLIEVLDFLATLLILARFVVGQILEQQLG